MTGSTVGNWRIGRLLGEGAFGSVHEADHVSIPGRRGAVKLLHGQIAAQAQLRQRFLNEASASSRAEHENIVQIFDAGTAPDGTCYMVMELLRGTTLTEQLRRGRMEPARAVHIGIQVAGALQAAHDINIVHRDLKPDNLFLVPRESNPDFVKVLDFGVCKLRGDVSENSKLTSTGMIIGTSAYMSPEQWTTRPDIDGRADIYALGVILFECLAGRPPFNSDSPYGYLTMHLTEQPPDLAPYGVPPRLAQTVRRMMGKERNHRQSTMREVIRDLRLALDQRPEPPRSVAPTMISQEPPRSLAPRQPEPVAPAYQSAVQPASVVQPVPPRRLIPPPQSAPLRDLMIKIGIGVLIAGGVGTYIYFNPDQALDMVKTPLREAFPFLFK